MVLFFGIVALIASTWLMLKLRKQRAFRGEAMVLQGRGFERSLRHHKSSTTLELGLSGSRGLELRIQKEDAFARFLASMNIGRDATCGDRALDRLLLFETDDPRVTHWLRNNSVARAAIGEIFDAGAHRLSAYDGRLWISLSGPKKQTDGEALSQRLAQPLIALLDSIPDSLNGKHERSLFHYGRALILLALSGGLGVTAVLMFFAHVVPKFPQHAQGFGLYATASLVSVLIGAVLWWFAAQWIKDSARARPVLIDLALVGFTSFVVICSISAGLLNVALASAPAFTEEVTAVAVVREQSRRKRRRGSSYFVELPLLHEGQVPANRYRLSAGEFARLQTGQRVRVETQRGFFGVYFMRGAPEPVQP